MKNLLSTFNFLRSGEATQRFHTVRTIGQNTVGEHSFQVAWLVYLLTDGAANARLLMAAMTHDLAEQVTGDIPAPTKRGLAMGADLTDMEERLLDEHELCFPLSKRDARTLKLADCLSGMLFCLAEREMGNQTIGYVFTNFRSYVEELAPTGVEAELLAIIVSKWTEII